MILQKQLDTKLSRIKVDSSSDGQSLRLWPVYMWSLSFLKPYLGLLLLLVGTVSLLSLAELIIPKFIQYFIDVILPESNRRLFYMLIIALAGVMGIVIGAGMLQNLLNRHLSEKAARDLQFTIFGHLRHMGFAYYEQNPVGQTLSFLNTEVAAVQQLYRQHFTYMIDGAIFSIISIVMMATTSLHLTAVVLPSFLLYYMFGPTLERKASITGKVMSEDRVEENQKVYESISALSEFRVFSAERWDLTRFMQKVANFNASMIRTYWYAYLRGTNRRLTYNIGAVVIFIYGYYLLQKKDLSVGEFISFLMFYFTAMHRLTVVVTNITEQKLLMYQAERLYRFVKQKPQVMEDENTLVLPEVKGNIEFDRVSFAYQSGQPVLENFSLIVAAGERVALVGTSGNGKSTVLKLLGRFYDPQQGQILLDGVPIERLSFATLRQSLGFVFQEMYMFGSTVRDNILFGSPDATEEELIHSAKAAYAHDFICELPDGYNTIVGERGVKLSGGQKQRIAIARMMISRPTVILLDEATSALDNTSETEVQRALETLLRGRTIIAVAHRLTTIQGFDKIVVIDKGRISEIGTYDELLLAGKSFAQLVRGMEMKGSEVHG